MAEKTNANIGFEKQLWDAACVLWGHIPAAEYRKVIIGLIFFVTSQLRLKRDTTSSLLKVTASKMIGMLTKKKTSSLYRRQLAGVRLPLLPILPRLVL